MNESDQRPNAGDLDRLFDIPDPASEASLSTRPLPPLPALPTKKSPTRDQRRSAITLTIGAALLYQIAWVALIEHRADIGRISTGLLLLGVAVPAALAAIVAGAALRRGPLGLGSSVSAFSAAIALSPVIFTIAALLSASRMTDETAPFWDRAVRCMAVTFVLTAPPMAMLSWIFRHAFVAASVWRTAALGVACGALGAATMSLACVHAEALHVVVAHGSMMILGGISGALVGRFFARA